MKRYKYTLVFAGIFIIYIFNLFIDIMDIDSAQYASIALEMMQNKSFLHVYHRGADYLDKPPLLFWLSSLSFSLFGVSNFAYKLPALLFTLLGIYATYRFTLLYYSKKTAVFAALMLSSTQVFFLITNDVRTDTKLTALVILAVWQLATFLKTHLWKNLILGFICVGMAMLAKGPISIITVIAALTSDFLLKRQWKNFFKWQWLVGVLIVALLLLPMSYGLYTQFDLHPEKSAYGIESPSGLKFFYWTQSVGRITGESSWKNDSSFFFFFHSILWDFQPWVVFLIMGLINAIFRLFKHKIRTAKDEYMSLGGFVLVFLALSLSNYKLPHYIFVISPFGAIIAARHLVSLTKKDRWIIGVQGIIIGLFWLILVLGLVLFFPVEDLSLPVVLLLLFVSAWYVFFKLRSTPSKLFFSTILTIIGFNFMLASHFYPSLIGNYQASNTVGKMVAQRCMPWDKFYFYKAHEHSLDFYSRRLVPSVSFEKLPQLASGTWVYTNAKGYDEIKKATLPYVVVLTLDDFPVTELSLPFLYRKTRPETLQKVYVLEKF